MRRILLAAAAVVVAVLLPGGPAWAHAKVVSADPAENATLTKAPASITLVFSERPNPDFTTIVVSDAGRQRIAASTPAVTAESGTVTLGRPLNNGSYTVAYRMVSVDGHSLQGSYVFTVADPARPAAAAAGPAKPAADSGGIPTGILIAAGLGVLFAAITAYLYVSRRRSAAST